MNRLVAVDAGRKSDPGVVRAWPLQSRDHASQASQKHTHRKG
jgi:hypothetical protein